MNRFVIFVPGGMGSKLTFKGKYVWSDGPTWQDTLDTLWTILDPSMMQAWFPLEAPAPLNFYDSFMGFLDGCGYSTDAAKNNLAVFSYDWRLSVADTGAQLNFLINKLYSDDPSRQFVVICHSLGCLVVRWALLHTSPMPIGNIERVIAAAPPGDGLPAAFRDMLEVPSITPLFDTALALAHLIYPERVEQIEQAIVRAAPGVTSLLELLPHSDKILNIFGPAISAWDWPNWPEELTTLRNDAKNRQVAPPTRPWGNVARTLIASNLHGTDGVYNLDPTGRKILSVIPVPGDGSVPLASAQVYMSSPGASDSTTLVASEHQALLDDPGARTSIKLLI